MVDRRGDRRRQELLEATLRVVGARGVKAVSHRSVAAQARVPLGSTTYYFASKDELLTETLRFAARTEIEDLEGRIGGLEPETMSADRWVEAVLDWLDGQLRGEARSRLIALYSLQLEAVHRPELRTVYEQWTYATLRAVRGQLARAGAVDAAAGAAVVVAAVDGLRHNQLATRDAGLSRPAGWRVVEPLVRQYVPMPAKG